MPDLLSDGPRCTGDLRRHGRPETEGAARILSDFRGPLIHPSAGLEPPAAGVHSAALGSAKFALAARSAQSYVPRPCIKPVFPVPREVSVPYTRREAIKLAAGVGASILLGKRPLEADLAPNQEAQLMRAIPSTGERIPAVGLGTARTFADAARTPVGRSDLREVVRLFTEQGGRVVDTAPTYGSSEVVLGDLARNIGNVEEILWATKVSGVRGRDQGMAQMAESEERLEPGDIFLNQVHNLGDWQTQLPLLHELKEDGRIRYVGVTTTSERDYDDVARILRTEELDFVQLDFSIDHRVVEQELFPIARDRGVATIAAEPFGNGRLFDLVAGHEPPSWASEIDADSWAQFFLKYLLGNPDMTVVIPATSDPAHLLDNMGAGVGRLPDQAMRRRMVDHIESL